MGALLKKGFKHKSDSIQLLEDAAVKDKFDNSSEDCRKTWDLNEEERAKHMTEYLIPYHPIHEYNGKVPQKKTTDMLPSGNSFNNKMVVPLHLMQEGNRGSRASNPTSSLPEGSFQKVIKSWLPLSFAKSDQTSNETELPNNQ